MTLIELKPRKALNKAFLKVKPSRSDIESFKKNLINLIDQINEAESEEFHKNLVSRFLRETYYGSSHFINTKGWNDLVIHNGKDSKSSVGVILEAKKPTNKSEMIKADNLNTKAFQELLLYYLRERITAKNLEIKYLVATNIYEWFIFDAGIFERTFAQNKALVKQFTDFEEKRLSDTRTEFFYKEIAESAIAAIESEFTFTHFDIREYEKPLRNDDRRDDSKLISLYKVLSPEHLLKLPFANDSNTLDKAFYTELLHIIGLTEIKAGGKKLIERKKEGERNPGALIENAIIELDSMDKISRLAKPFQFGETNEERLSNIGLELAITWVNRILFLKLLEAQLINYHRGDRAYAFLNIEKVRNFDDLNTLFFQVLAKKQSERNQSVKAIFANVPYLNSSLFEPTEIEHSCFPISQLKDEKLPILSSTVLKDRNGKRRTGEIAVLEYIFEFLNAYDFASEGLEEIQEENKTLINASVLGLIFEKINGYKDGSFFTPGFITMYMCRETIRRAVVQKFNEAKGWNCKDIVQLHNTIQPEDYREANAIINSLKICDPAVGSGHFLVSALNEIIAIKSELKILIDRHGKTMRGYHVEVVNDELIVTNEDGELFEYNPHNKESQRIQETLFHEKETIIENCLFGVDINPNSVKICRLRLWIELLKNAYYTAQSNYTELETLPNIDINIKCGNSLISRYPLDADIKKALKKSKWSIDSYRAAVMSYRNAQSKDEKRAMEKLIDEIKNDFESEVASNDKRVVRRRKAQDELLVLTNQTRLFEQTASEKARWNKQVKKLSDEIQKLETELEEIKSNKIYENAFEWRFEFPEVLNDDGEFVGFDVVIGNPPYVRHEAITEFKQQFSKEYEGFYCGTADLYTYFYKKGIDLVNLNGHLCFIAPNKFMRAGYGKNTRELLTRQATPKIVIDFGDLTIFDATTYPSILLLEKNVGATGSVAQSGRGSASPLQKSKFLAATFTDLSQLERIEETLSTIGFTMPVSALKPEGWNLEQPEVLALMEKLRAAGKPLGEYVQGSFYRGVLTGLNEAFVIDAATRERLIAEDPKSVELIKPWLRGRDIRKWRAEWPGLYVIFTRRGVDIENYPAIKRHLEQFREDLEPKKSEKQIRGRKPGSYKWFEIQDNIAYYEEFERAKIMYAEIATEGKFLFDNKGYYSDTTSYIMASNSEYLLGILNSRLFTYMFSKTSSEISGGFLRWKSQYMNPIPIFPATDAQKAPIVERVKKILINPESYDVLRLEAEIDQLVYKLYGLTEQEIAVVEGKG